MGGSAGLLESCLSSCQDHGTLFEQACECREGIARGRTRKALSGLSAFALQDSGKLALLVMHRHLARGGQKHTLAALLARVRCCPSRVAVLSDLALQFTQSSGTALSQRCVCRSLSHIFLCLLLSRIVLHFIRVVHISILFSNFTFFSFKQYRDNSTLKDYILNAVFSQLISSMYGLMLVAAAAAVLIFVHRFGIHRLFLIFLETKESLRCLM